MNQRTINAFKVSGIKGCLDNNRSHDERLNRSNCGWHNNLFKRGKILI